MPRLSHARISFYIAAGAGLVAWGWAWFVAPYLALVIGVDVFFAAYLARAMFAIPGLDAAQLRRNAGKKDEPLWVVFAITLAAAALAVALVIALGGSRHPDRATAALTIASMPLAWATVHTMMAWHYAHMYWRRTDGEEDDAAGAGEVAHGFHGGLQFPGGKAPGARDFFYFSFIIGMAAQTADVSISSSRIRAVSLVHSLVSFVFNTVLLAAVLNVVLSLA
jgi:uncharacterized membrane protein